MAEVIRDEEVRRRVRLAQEFLDPDDVSRRRYGAHVRLGRRRLTAPATDLTFW